MTANLPTSASGTHPATIAATVLAFVAYFVLLHLLIASDRMPLLALVVVIAPWLVTLVALPLRSGRIRGLGLPLRVAIAAALLAAVGFAIWTHADELAAHAGLTLYLENLAFHGALAATFALSLRDGREALVTRFARRARNGDMPQPVVAYTRSATAAWAAFFAAMAIVSTVLFFTGSRAAWSAFVNLAVWPLVAAMFALEYAVRLRVLRDFPHGTILTAFHAFRQDARGDRIDAEGRSS